MAKYLLCSWAPRLKAPPEGAAGLVKKTATEVLAELDRIVPASETRREMGSLFDSIETGKPARTVQVPARAVAPTPSGGARCRLVTMRSVCPMDCGEQSLSQIILPAPIA